jgi:hypothetical protein
MLCVAVMVPLVPFAREHSTGKPEEFLSLFEGSFVLARIGAEDPRVLFLPNQPSLSVRVGALEENDIVIGDLAPRQFTFRYHEGFSSWVASKEPNDAGVSINGDPVDGSRVSLVPDRAVIKPTQGDVVMQFFGDQSFWNQIIMGYKRSRTARFRRPKAT